MNIFCRLGPHRWLLSLITLLIVIRAAILTVSPPGFYSDEAFSGAHVVAMLYHHTNAQGSPWPLFSHVYGGGYITPTYLYPLTLWVKLFGASELAIRAFSTTSTILACIVLGIAIHGWTRSNLLGLTMTAVSLALPWGWLQGSLAWDPALVPLYVALSLCATSILYRGHCQNWRIFGLILLPLSITALAYVYPPCRITAPLLLIFFYSLLIWQGRIRINTAIVSTMYAGITVIPLALFMFTPAALKRSQDLSVFHKGIWSGLEQFLLNLFGLLNPYFLFATGDPNQRHSTGVQGMLGIAALIPLLVIIWQMITRVRHWRAHAHPASDTVLLLVIALFGIVASLIPSALTDEGHPHSLRACAAWPFFAVLITLGWRQLIHISGYPLLVTVVIALGSTLFYALDLASRYPARAAGSFDVPIRQAINAGKPWGHYGGPLRDYYRRRQDAGDTIELQCCKP